MIRGSAFESGHWKNCPPWGPDSLQSFQEWEFRFRMWVQTVQQQMHLNEIFGHMFQALKTPIQAFLQHSLGAELIAHVSLTEVEKVESNVQLKN